LRAIVVQNVPEGFFNPFPFTDHMVQVFEAMRSLRFGFPG
jgi:hypothetical protein